MDISLPITVKSMSFAYSEIEDRLVWLVEEQKDDRLALMFTRRLTERLVNGLAGIIEVSSLSVKHAPAEMRGDVILLEHQGAVSAATELVDAAESTKAYSAAVHGMTGEVPVRLVTSVSVNTLPENFDFVLRDGETALAHFRVNRTELHRILSIISGQAQAAEWSLRTEVGWLKPGQTTILLN
jgi:hypothetical protein